MRDAPKGGEAHVDSFSGGGYEAWAADREDGDRAPASGPQAQVNGPTGRGLPAALAVAARVVGAARLGAEPPPPRLHRAADEPGRPRRIGGAGQPRCARRDPGRRPARLAGPQPCGRRPPPRSPPPPRPPPPPPPP